jgi:hypothetical protein
MLTILAWGVMAVFGHSLWWLGLGIVMLDVGASATHIAKQTTLFALKPGNRTRFITVYIVGQSLGGGLLALLTGMAWARGGWLGVCILGAATTILALIVNSVPAGRCPLRDCFRSLR